MGLALHCNLLRYDSQAAEMDTKASVSNVTCLVPFARHVLFVLPRRQTPSMGHHVRNKFL